jgi:hypothetical protein
VKPDVKRQKNDAADAEAICEAVTRPNMRFVPTKKVDQQNSHSCRWPPPRGLGENINFESELLPQLQ